MVKLKIFLINKTAPEIEPLCFAAHFSIGGASFI